MKWEGRPEGDDDLASRAKRRLPCSPSNGEPEGNLTVDLRFKLRLASGRKRRAVRSPDDVSKRKKKSKERQKSGVEPAYLQRTDHKPYEQLRHTTL